MIKTTTIIKVANRIGTMVELVKEINGVKTFCPFQRHEVKVDENGTVLVAEKAYKAKEWFFRRITW